MRRKVQGEVGLAGQDSFLDVVTNIVGILIILVMVVGMRARNEPSASAQEAAVSEKLLALRSQSKATEHDVLQTESELDALDRELALRSQERELVATMIAARQQDLETRQAQMDEKARREWQLQTDLANAQTELQRIKDQTTGAQAATTVVKIESYPTPVSRTVHGHEAHFQLSRGRILYVPFEELLDRAKSEIQRHRLTVEDLPERDFEVGPLEGFRLLLTMRGSIVPNTNQMVFGLKHAEFVPVSRELGEAIDDAIAPRSEFSARLAGYNPKDTTITVWFYPDSFDEFRALKKQLYSMGFATAGWPLAEGTYISGSPQGKRSAAE